MPEPSARGTFESLIDAVKALVAPLDAALSSASAFRTFMADMGWRTDQVIGPVSDLRPAIKALQEIDTEGGLSEGEVALALGKISEFFARVASVGAASGSLPSSINRSAFVAEFPTQLRDYLVTEYLFTHLPRIGAALQLLGVIRLRFLAGSGQRLGFVKREVAWSDLPNVLSGPAGVFRNAFAWDSAHFDGTAFLGAVGRFGKALGLEIDRGTVAPLEFAYLTRGAAPAAISARHDAVVAWQLVSGARGLSAFGAGLKFALVPESPAGKPGFAILPYVAADSGWSTALSEETTLSIAGSASFGGGIGLVVRPGQAPRLESGILSNAPAVAAELALSLIHASVTGEKAILLGSANSGRLETGALAVRGGARLRAGSGTDLSAYVECEVSEAAIVITTGARDGFLAKLLGDRVTIGFAGTLGLDSEYGLYFTGSSGLEIEIPAHIQLGPIEIHSAAIAIKPENQKIPIELTTTLGANFGFLTALVENVGIRAELSSPPNGGALGPFDFDIGPRPPNGIAVGVDAGVVRGFGYFYFDHEREEYGGALELTIAELFSVKAFGLVNTRMPNGEKGFSMVVIMTFEFPDPGIQVGLGFRLLGVGGIIGVERNLDLDELVQRMRSGALLRLLYPKSLEANVVVPLFDDLRAIFPIGTSTLLGPFFKLAYGTPTLVDIKIGVIFEIPGNIAIIGVVSAVLPKEEGAVLRLTVSFVGVIEPGKKRIWFFAVLFDSRLVSFVLEGELGLLAQYGNDSALLLSAGGFHPRYDPPPLPFPTPARLALEILNKDNAKIRAEAYFAIWSGGVMFGVRAELYFGYSEFKLTGDVHWDCLIRFNPFSFDVDIGASLSAEVFGVGCFSVHIGLHLEGPKKYRANGRIKIAIRFAPDIHKRLDKEWGSDAGGQLPSIQIFDLVAAEIDRPANWGTELPNGARLLVTLRDRAEGDAAIVVHPSGRVRVSQGMVPLGLTLEKVGNQRPSDVNHLTLSPVGASLTKIGDVLDRFAAGQFLDIGEAALSRADFEPMKAGILVDGPGDEYTTGHAVRRRVRYEEIVIDTNYKRSSKRFSPFPGKLFTQLLKNASVTKSALSKAQRTRLESSGDKAAVLTEETYSVARQRDNKSLDASPLKFSSQAAAHEYMKTQMAANPALRGQLHVIPSYELAA